MTLRDIMQLLEDRIFFATVLSHSTVAKKFGKISCQIPEPLGCTVLCSLWITTIFFWKDVLNVAKNFKHIGPSKLTCLSIMKKSNVNYAIKFCQTNPILKNIWMCYTVERFVLIVTTPFFLKIWTHIGRDIFNLDTEVISNGNWNLR